MMDGIESMMNMKKKKDPTKTMQDSPLDSFLKILKKSLKNFHSRLKQTKLNESEYVSLNNEIDEFLNKMNLKYNLKK